MADSVEFRPKMAEGCSVVVFGMFKLERKVFTNFHKKVIVENMPCTTSEPFAVLKLYSNGMANLNF